VVIFDMMRVRSPPSPSTTWTPLSRAATQVRGPQTTPWHQPARLRIGFIWAAAKATCGTVATITSVWLKVGHHRHGQAVGCNHGSSGEGRDPRQRAIRLPAREGHA